MLRSNLDLYGENLLIPGASEKIVYRIYIAVPRINTDALAEKAKT